MTDDEKFLWKGQYTDEHGDNLAHYHALALENAIASVANTMLRAALFRWLEAASSPVVMTAVPKRAEQRLLRAERRLLSAPLEGGPLAQLVGQPSERRERGRHHVRRVARQSARHHHED